LYLNHQDARKPNPENQQSFPFCDLAVSFLLVLDIPPRGNKCSSMPIETKIRKIGNSLGIVLPKEALLALKAGEGDRLFLTEAPNASLRISADQPGFEEIMDIAHEGMNRYRNALRELAK